MANFEIDTAVIIAAGVGTRGLPVSKYLPKEMSEVYGLPLVGRVVADLAAIGIRNIITVVGEDLDVDGRNYQETLLRRWFEPNPRLEQYLMDNGKADKLPLLEQGHDINFFYATQPDDGKYGTAAPLYAARRLLNEVGKFLVVNGDDLIIGKDGTLPLGAFIQDVGESGRKHGIMVRPVARQESGVYPYGIATPDENNRLEELLEQPDASLVIGEPLMNTGKYLFDESFLKPLSQYMKSERAQRSHQEYRVTDVISMLEDVHVHKSEGRFLDAGDARLRLIASMTLAGLDQEIIDKAWEQLKNAA